MPIPFRAKKPTDNDWQSRIIDAAAAPLYFNGGPQNIGVVLGPSSHGLTDVDLDVPEAVAIAPYLLPPTEAIFGRISKRTSHRLYVTDLSAKAVTAAIRFKAPDGATLLELRIGGNKGAQTVFPGSTHKETGEPIAWETNGEPAVVDGVDLLVRVKRVAATCLIARNWPTTGSRHDIALVLGGFLSRGGLTEAEIKLIIEASSRAAADPEWHDRVQAAKDAARAHIAGKSAAGFSKLAEFIDEAVVKKISEWLHVPASSQPAQSQGATTTVGSSWPQIRIIPGEIPRIVNEAENALLLLDREIYQRGGLVMRPVLTTFKASKKREVQGWRLVPVSRPYLVDTLTCAAQFWKYSGRSKNWVTTDAPDKVAEIYLARQGQWKLPVLSGIIHTPFLRTDGSICEQPGYDPASGLLFKPDDQSFPSISQFPSQSEAIVALGQLEQLIATFPFVQEMDRSVALSALLTILDRRSMATAPLHAFSSPTAGTGKSLLVDIAAVLATGRPMPVISQGRSEEELEKRLGAALLAGDTAISLDNCDRTLEGVFLCQVLTQPQLNIRVLGKSHNIETPVNATIFATGNNLTIGGDAIRRSLLSSMDAGCERPELRVFNVNAVEDAKARRGELVSAALTVLRAWHVATPGIRLNLPSFGSFEEWSRRIREPLVWLGKVDPCETLTEVRKSDPYRDALIAVIMQWKENLTLDSKYTVQQVIEYAINTPSFYTALLSVAATQTGRMVSNIVLGRWLKRVQGKIVNGFVLLQDGSMGGYPLWKLTPR